MFLQTKRALTFTHPTADGTVFKLGNSNGASVWAPDWVKDSDEFTGARTIGVVLETGVPAGITDHPEIDPMAPKDSPDQPETPSIDGASLAALTASFNSFSAQVSQRLANFEERMTRTEQNPLMQAATQQSIGQSLNDMSEELQRQKLLLDQLGRGYRQANPENAEGEYTQAPAVENTIAAPVGESEAVPPTNVTTVEEDSTHSQSTDAQAATPIIGANAESVTNSTETQTDGNESAVPVEAKETDVNPDHINPDTNQPWTFEDVNAKQWLSGATLVGKLNDFDLLNRLANEAQYDKVREAATQRLEQLSS